MRFGFYTYKKGAVLFGIKNYWFCFQDFHCVSVLQLSVFMLYVPFWLPVSITVLLYGYIPVRGAGQFYGPIRFKPLQ
jgi:hypothetical protein